MNPAGSTHGKSSNRSLEMFNVKLTNIQKILLLERKNLILEVGMRSIILIDPFSPLLWQGKDGYPYSVISLSIITVI